MADRVKCQCCGRMLVPLKDGTSRRHFSGRKRHVDDWDRDSCRGSGFRLDRWPVGQRLRHHGGSVWEVVSDFGGPHADYGILCVVGTWNGRYGEPEGKAQKVHGEYMHRHGWTPVAGGERDGD